MLITAEEKLNRYGYHYAYYRCSKKRLDFKCQQPYLSQKALEEQVQQELNRHELPTEIHDWAISKLARRFANRSIETSARKTTLQQDIGAITDRLNRLTDMRVRDQISESEFVANRAELEQERFRVQQAMDQPNDELKALEPFYFAILFSKYAASWFRVADNQTKRLILETIGSNFLLKDKILTFLAKKPFTLIANATSIPTMLTVLEAVRTFSLDEQSEFEGTISGIRTLIN